MFRIIYLCAATLCLNAFCKKKKKENELSYLRLCFLFSLLKTFADTNQPSANTHKKKKKIGAAYRKGEKAITAVCFQNITKNARTPLVKNTECLLCSQANKTALCGFMRFRYECCLSFFFPKRTALVSCSLFEVVYLWFSHSRFLICSSMGFLSFHAHIRIQNKNNK